MPIWIDYPRYNGGAPTVMNPPSSSSPTEAAPAPAPAPAPGTGSGGSAGSGFGEFTDEQRRWAAGHGWKLPVDARLQRDEMLPDLSGYSDYDALYPVIEAINYGLGTQELVRMIELGRLDPGIVAQLGPYIAARQAENDDRSGMDAALRDFVGTEKMHFENVGESWQADPERALLGINTPFESWLWGELLDKDYDANIDMYGGPTKDTYQEAAAAGYDPSIDAFGHGVTQSVLGTIFGAKLAGYNPGPAGRMAVGAGRGAFAAANAGADGGEALRRGMLGALGGYAGTSTPTQIDYVDDAPAMAAPIASPAFSMPPAGAVPMTGEFSMPAAIPISNAEQAALPIATPASLPGYEAAYGGMLSSLMPPAVAEEGDPTAPVEPTPEPAPEQSATETIQKYVKVAKTLYDIFGQDEGSAPEGAPTQDEGETPDQYGQELAQYMELDPAAMAEAGLEPGTPEYFEFIMQAADATIAQVLGDMDVDAADFAQQLRAKTESELLQLQRALYVRGQMDQLMGSGTYEDPATGTAEEVVGAGMFNPGVAGYQRGVARNVGELGGLEGQAAMDYLNSWLGRNVDMYGMQGEADERFELAKREEEMRRKRGMFGNSF